MEDSQILQRSLTAYPKGNDLLSLVAKMKDVHIEMYADNTAVCTDNEDVSIATSHCQEVLAEKITF